MGGRVGGGVWGVQEHRWVGNVREASTGQDIIMEVVGWYLPVSKVDEERLPRPGVRVVVQMARKAQEEGQGNVQCAGAQSYG